RLLRQLVLREAFRNSNTLLILSDDTRQTVKSGCVDDVPWSGGGFGRVVCVVDVGEPSCDGQ
ncbi:hypothetical protein, partial [uncultured Aeromicrobium sp.]|uniref:hypothetical protein n=1 Tax=uncultured Aeromicrobium sp. TaxID=337820 RepID=UPI0025F49276